MSLWRQNLLHVFCLLGVWACYLLSGPVSYLFDLQYCKIYSFAIYRSVACSHNMCLFSKRSHVARKII